MVGRRVGRDGDCNKSAETNHSERHARRELVSLLLYLSTSLPFRQYRSRASTGKQHAPELAEPLSPLGFRHERVQR